MITQKEEVRINILYSEAVGKLKSLMIGSRPDIGFAVCNITRVMGNPGIQQSNSIKHISLFKGPPALCISYIWSPSHIDMNFLVYCNADLGGDVYNEIN